MHGSVKRSVSREVSAGGACFCWTTFPIATQSGRAMDASQPGKSATEMARDPSLPRWILDLYRFLPLKSQFVFFGNIRDRFPLRAERGFLPQPLTRYLAHLLARRGYQKFLAFNPIDGFTPVTLREEDAESDFKFWRDALGVPLDPAKKPSLQKALETIQGIVDYREQFVAVFADLASRYVVRPDALTEREHEFFSRALLMSNASAPHVTAEKKEAQFNPVFWLCDRENDLPAWFLVDNPRVRSIAVPRPDAGSRRDMIGQIGPGLAGWSNATEAERTRVADLYVDQTDGMFLNDVIAIGQLCTREQLPFSRIGEAVRRYKLGVTEDPWSKIEPRKIIEGEPFIRRRVKGQRAAVCKSLDIVKRSITGLSGAQGSSNAGKPRGVMFLAGPTGVGKTELAKTLTELLFGDEQSYIRFDMSEFAAEHADQRLLGAPPGYIGYDSGGELTNRIKEKPFAVVLFDEIEKAHPRVLDKFLQILDDGVLTSGRGERVYFSEAVIVFTSNLGIYRVDSDGTRILNVSPADSYAVVESKIRDEIGRYFKEQLNRPELLNRIGENIVVFDFIRPDVAVQIFDKMMANILERVSERRELRIDLGGEARRQLLDRCIADLSLGGRGIGNKLEAYFINPLARALFDDAISPGTRIEVSGIAERDGVPVIVLKQL
jgi:hypothetical protein